ncbi:trace amine-associated receptor 5 [Biomphalaria pfeifferi]|uniref:Trace amine-associated receptor 5 n=1 Tax=Biomphalaria pfeifferi TaxID=112525 RepID=A0AAD8EVD0_BIOPF|nr:trace amine-associated receptor 5 [Biomphalaria pfeifferi]
MNETNSDNFYTNNTGILISVGAFMASIATLTVLANVIVFVAMALTLTRDIRRGLTTVARSSNNSYITRFLVLSMTTSGVIVGGFIMPLSLLQLINNGQWLFGYTLCVVMTYTDYLLCAVSTLHTLFMAIDTYLVICKPLLYRRLTPKIAYLMIALGWLAPILLVILWTTLQKNKVSDCLSVEEPCDPMNIYALFNFIFGMSVFVLFLAVVYLYLLILRQVVVLDKRSSKDAKQTAHLPVQNNSQNDSLESKIHICKNYFVFIVTYSIKALKRNDSNNDFSGDFSLNSASDTSINSANVSPINSANVSIINSASDSTIKSASDSPLASTSEVIRTKKMKTNARCFRFVGLILAWFSICWLPAWTSIILCESCTVCLPDWTFVLLNWLTYFSCTINPLVYCSQKSIKNAVRSLLCQCCKHTK